ncbi:MAG TPA: protein kinase [Gemmatimonadota bacterium]|nr:protein kinase [Gemmatimonadota bacterium]
MAASEHESAQLDGLVCESCSTPLPGGSKYCSECGTPAPGQRGPLYASFPTDLRQALQMATAGEYEIHHELGRGGMGSVFLAREVGLDRLVAIKVLPPNLMFDEGLIERFKREARMVAKLHHPNIIPVYRVHHSHNLAFYTMHFVPGRSLAEIMGPNRIPSLQEVERVLLEAAAGLGYAHKRGVIHRDVKPANILIDAEGHVHLTDFGIAKALVGSTHLTETGAVIGTPQYMAPEQCEGRMVDGRADQYSLAAVGYQLLTGQPPFVSDSMKELLYHHLFTPPRPLNAVRPETPLPLRDAIHKALSKDPADRFDTMEDFRLAVEGKGPPIYVPWLDEKGDRRRTTPVPGPHPYRRSGDPPTTERLRQAPWISNGNGREEILVSEPGMHRHAMGAMAVAVVAIAVAAVFAITKGGGLDGPWQESLAANSPAGQELMSEGTMNPPATDPGTAAPASKAGDIVAAKETGRLVVAGDLPSGASLQIEADGIDEPVSDGSTLDLSPGRKQVTISAAGFSPFTREIIVESGQDVTLDAALTALPREQPRPVTPRPADTRPAVPAGMKDELEEVMEQGRVLHDLGRYVEAVEIYREVMTRAGDAVAKFRNASAFRALQQEAEEAIRAAKSACRYEAQPNCPT